MYKILQLLNKILFFFNLEIRKKKSFPFYYIQNFKIPPYVRTNGVYVIPIDKIMSPHGFGYGPKGWHFYTEALREFMAYPERGYKNSVLKKYYDVFCPKTVADIFNFDGSLSNADIIQTLPALLIRDFWRLDGSLNEVLAQVQPEETQLYGPISDFYGEEQYIRCVNSYKLIDKHGYIPDRFEDGYLSGYFLKNGDDFRYIVMGGKHRLAALSVLGYKDIKVTCPYNLKLLDIDDIDNWPTVRSGLISKDEVRRIFQLYFTRDGSSFASRWNLRF